MLPFTRRALGAGLLTAALATAGCGSDQTDKTPDGDRTTTAAQSKPSPAEMMLAKRTKVRECLAASGHDATAIDASEMRAPADIKRFVKGSGAGVLHLDVRKSDEGPQPDPAVDILVSAGKPFDPEFGVRVVDWLDDRAGVSDQPAGEGPSSDIAAPTGPMGVFEGPNLDGITAIVYDAPPRGFRNKLTGCNVLGDGGTTLDQEQEARQSSDESGTEMPEQDGPTSTADEGPETTPADEYDGGSSYPGDGGTTLDHEELDRQADNEESP